jgi:hypothetical protein
MTITGRSRRNGRKGPITTNEPPLWIVRLIDVEWVGLPVVAAVVGIPDVHDYSNITVNVVEVQNHLNPASPLNSPTLTHVTAKTRVCYDHAIGSIVALNLQMP